jgi:hypothetical protein
MAPEPASRITFCPSRYGVGARRGPFSTIACSFRISSSVTGVRSRAQSSTRSIACQ